MIHATPVTIIAHTFVLLAPANLDQMLLGEWTLWLSSD